MSSNTFTLGTKSVNRLGYGAMQLAGPGVFGPPRDRHVAITVLREALAGLQDAEAAAQDYLPYDCIVIDVRSAIDLLGEITGDTVQDEIINEIFERFCIGK